MTVNIKFLFLSIKILEDMVSRRTTFKLLVRNLFKKFMPTYPGNTPKEKIGEIPLDRDLKNILEYFM